jgi:competence protein ComEA
LRSLPRPVDVSAPVAAPAPTPSTAPALFVHVAGWVRNPGVYELREGDRVIDAIRLAGGPRRRADLSVLNLAAPLTDGQQVLVPRPAADGPPGAVPTPGITPGSSPGLVNVNTATAEQLETLPGIGEVLAATIIQYREEHGPFTSVDQLLDVSGIGEVTLEEIRELVTV